MTPAPSAPASDPPLQVAGSGEAAEVYTPPPGPAEMTYPSFVPVGKVGQQMLIDLGSFVCFRSAKTTWQVSVDWGDGKSSLMRVRQDGGIGAMPHTYTRAGNFIVTVGIEDDWFQTAQHAFTVKVN